MSSSARYVASMCIEYCRGTGVYQYSVLGQTSCTCGSVLASSSTTSLVAGNDWTMCSRSSSYSMYGSGSDSGDFVVFLEFKRPYKGCSFPLTYFAYLQLHAILFNYVQQTKFEENIVQSYIFDNFAKRVFLCLHVGQKK